MKWISILFHLAAAMAFANQRVEISQTEYVVKFNAQALQGLQLQSMNQEEDLSSFFSLLTGSPLKNAKLLARDQSGMVVLMQVDPSMADPVSFRQQMRKPSPLIEWAYPNRIYHGDYRESFGEEIFNDPQISRQHHLRQIQALSALAIQFGRPEVVLAVTDDGFDLDHEDLAEIWWRNPSEIPGNGIDDDSNGYIDDHIGWNFSDKNNNPDYDGDYGSHGTHIAGIIAGMANNGRGVIGVAPGLKVMPLKFFGEGRWSSAVVYETYAYAVKMGAKIINTSYNVDSMASDPIYRQAMREAHDAGVLIFNSAGNNNQRDPARSSLETVFLVASVDASHEASKIDRKSRFSNYGYQIDISAPGGNILATGTNNRYVSLSGTSMASPMAAAMAGLIWSEFPDYSPRMLTHVLLSAVDSIASVNPGYNHQLGFGRINALKILDPQVLPLQIEVPELQNSAGLPKKRVRDNTLQLRFRGSPGAAPRPISILAMEPSLRQYQQRLRIQQEIFLATNQIEYRFDNLAPGRYKLHIPQDAFLDPWGRHLDGDYDGVPGGDLEIEFEVSP